MAIWHDRPTLQEVAASRTGPILKGPSRLEKTVEAKPLTRVTEKDFKAEVWKRDRNRCRWCERKVQKQMDRAATRGEVHHIHGRAGALRFEDRAALLLCLSCHEKVTGRVNERWRILGTAFFSLQVKGSRFDNTAYIDARKPVRFERVA